MELVRHRVLDLTRSLAGIDVQKNGPRAVEIEHEAVGERFDLQEYRRDERRAGGEIHQGPARRAADVHLLPSGQRALQRGSAREQRIR